MPGSGSCSAGKLQPLPSRSPWDLASGVATPSTSYWSFCAQEEPDGWQAAGRFGMGVSAVGTWSTGRSPDPVAHEVLGVVPTFTTTSPPVFSRDSGSQERVWVLPLTFTSWT